MLGWNKLWYVQGRSSCILAGFNLSDLHYIEYTKTKPKFIRETCIENVSDLTLHKNPASRLQLISDLYRIAAK